MLNDDNIKDLFNKLPDDNQDWLEPSDELLGSIEDRIYEEDKKRKPVWFFFGSLLLIASCFLLILNISDDHQVKQEALSTLSTSKDKVTSDSQESIASVESKNSENENLNAFPSNDEISVKSEFKSKSTSNETVISNNKNKIETYKENTIDLTYQSPFLRKDISAKESITTNKEITNEIKEVIATNDNEKIKTKHVETTANLDISKLNISSIAQLSLDLLPMTDRNTPTIINTFSKVEKPQTIKNSFSIASGISIWNFSLNQNYLTALSPADFTYENGIGINLSLGYEHNIAPKMSINTSLTAEKVKHTSGHNSSVNYNTTTEQNLQNQIDLTMASPMGFLESQVIVQRAREDSPQPANDLILDLHNEHENYNVDLNVSLLREIIHKNNFKGLLQLGGGVNHLFGLQNKLAEVNIDNVDFSSINNSITSNQENINTTRPYFNLGLSVENRVSENLDFRLSYIYKKDLVALYSSEDFNTHLSRQLIQASFKLTF